MYFFFWEKEGKGDRGGGKERFLAGNTIVPQNGQCKTLLYLTDNKKEYLYKKVIKMFRF